MKKIIAKATLERAPSYLDYLNKINDTYVSATSIAKNMKLGEVQVRKDLSALCGRGKPRVGYLKEELIKSLKEFSDNRQSVIVVGAGKIGRALLGYDGFKEYGLDIVAAFDLYEDVDSHIYKYEKMAAYIKKNKIKMAILAVPKSEALKVFDDLKKCGIKAVLSFVKIRSDDIRVKYIDIAASLAHLKQDI